MARDGRSEGIHAQFRSVFGKYSKPAMASAFLRRLEPCIPSPKSLVAPRSRLISRVSYTRVSKSLVRFL